MDPELVEAIREVRAAINWFSATVVLSFIFVVIMLARLVLSSKSLNKTLLHALAVDKIRWDHEQKMKAILSDPESGNDRPTSEGEN